MSIVAMFQAHSRSRQEGDGGGSRKRSLEDFTMDAVTVEGAPAITKDADDGIINPPNPIFASLPDLPKQQSPPPQSSPASLTDGLSSTPPRNSPSPNPTPTHGSPVPPTTAPPTQQPQQSQPAPAPSTGMPQPQPQAAKRRKLTAAEKTAKAEEEAQKKKEREELKQQRLAEKAKRDQEKEIARAAKMAEKAKRDAEEAEAKAEKRRKREEEERKAQEEKEKKEKKERSQLRLNMFFKTPSKAPTTPSKAAAVVSSIPDQPSAAEAGSPAASKSYYDRMFPPFHIKPHVHLATSHAELDQETKATKAAIMDEYLSGQRREADIHPFDPVKAFQLISRPQRRGRLHPPVKKLMGEIQQSGAVAARQTLKKVPMKLLCFKQDVRPPYFGTVTCHQHQVGESRMKRLARHPNERVLDLQYDYDSEAEWQDDEPGEDLDDMDDDEEEDGDDDMDGFLDDTDDAGLGRRLFGGGEPESTGICFEDGQRAGSRSELGKFRMEFIHEKVDHHQGIDPFSAQYWEKEVKKEVKKKPAPAGQATLTGMAPPPPPNGPNGSVPPVDNGGVPSIKPEYVADFKRIVTEHAELTKVGIVDLLFSFFRTKGLTRAETKKMLDSGAYRLGKVNGAWKLRDGL